MGRTHAATGAAAGTASGLAAGLRPGHGLLVWTAVTALAALGPDLDHPGSYLGRRVVPLSWLVGKLAGGHRAGTHSLAGTAVVLLLALWLVPWLAVPVGLGWLVHIAGDWLTLGGVPWFYPFRKRRFSRPVLGRTGGWDEPVILGASFLVATSPWWLS